MANYTLSSWKQKGRTFRWNGYEIFYIDEDNDKVPLLLIHGFPTASLDWHKVWDELSEHYRLITLDMIGFGFSDKPSEFEYSIKKQADIILDFLKKLKVNTFHILAHDYGDSVAQELVARYNAFTYQDIDQYKILSVCLLNGGIFPDITNHLLIQKLLLGPLGFLLSRLLNKKRFEKNFKKVFTPETMISNEELSEYWQLVSRRRGHRIAHKIIRYLIEREEQYDRWLQALRRLREPLALINGPLDPISGENMIKKYKEVVSQENVYPLNGIGHYPQLEAPGELIGAYLDFSQKSQTKS